MSESPNAAGSGPFDVAVVGAGVAGSAAAREFAARGLRVVVIDKGRGVGGRASTRRAEPFAFDHGAQYFTARGAAFRREVAGWLEAGVAAVWGGRVVALREGAATPAGADSERFVGVPGMNAPLRHVCAGLDVRTGQRVERLLREGGLWHLADGNGAPLASAERVLVTTPPAQAAALVGEASPLGARADAVAMLPCWSVLLGFARPVEADFDGAFCDGEALGWVARDSSKPGRPAREAWVLHAAPAWTAARLERPREEVARELARAFERASGVALPRIEHAAAHLWRYARPTEERDLGVLLDAERGLALAGDGYPGGRVEGAWTSGLAAARALS